MSFLRKHTEIIFSYIIGIVSLFTGLIIFINLPLIKQFKGDKKVDTHVHNVWEFLNAFFAEIIKVMSKFIGGFPITSAIVIIVFGILVMLLGHTLFRTIKYDYDISIFFLVIGIMYFIITLLLMTQVYGFFAIVFIIPFTVHIGYIVYKEELNQDNRKNHYMWIIVTYGMSYLITQISLYGRIDANEIESIDILSVNTFFIIMWLLGQMAIWNFLFLRRSLPLTKEELGEEEPELSRTNKGNVSNQTKVHLKQLQNKTTEYARKTRRSVDLDKIRAKRDKFKQKINSIVDIQEDDIPSWMKKPKWVKPMYVQLFCGVIILFFAFLEFNNRNALFLTGEWELSQTQYVVEWVTLLLLLFIIIIYIATTLTYYLRDKYYYLQLFMGSILFFKFLTEFINIMVHGLLLSIFITPILLLMLIAMIVAYSLQLREK
ncbi:lipoteichoic acid stability factor AuxA [Staphylococcus epidermidis]